MSILAAILRASNLVALNSKVQNVLPSHFPFFKIMFIPKKKKTKKQLVSIWFVVFCHQSGLSSFGKLSQSLEHITGVGSRSRKEPKFPFLTNYVT